MNSRLCVVSTTCVAGADGVDDRLGHQRHRGGVQVGLGLFEQGDALSHGKKLQGDLQGSERAVSAKLHRNCMVREK